MDPPYLLVCFACMQRNDSPLVIGLLLAFLGPAAIILGIAASTGYLDKLYANSLTLNWPRLLHLKEGEAWCRCLVIFVPNLRCQLEHLFERLVSTFALHCFGTMICIWPFHNLIFVQARQLASTRVVDLFGHIAEPPHPTLSYVNYPWSLIH